MIIIYMWVIFNIYNYLNGTQVIVWGLRCRIKISCHSEQADGQPTSHGGCIVLTDSRGSLRALRYPVFYCLPRGDTKQDVFALGRKRESHLRGLYFNLTIYYWLLETLTPETISMNHLVPHIKYWPGYLSRSRDWFISHDKDIISIITSLILSLGIIPNKTWTLPPRKEKRKYYFLFQFTYRDN